MKELINAYLGETNSKKQKQLKNDILEKIRDAYPSYCINYTEDNYVSDLKCGLLRYIENMSAKEPLNDEFLTSLCNDVEQGKAVVEEKLDGTRVDLQVTMRGVRLFSRRISKKTNWYSENTYNFPTITRMDIPAQCLGTVLDGELTARDFKEISSLSNCNWDEAIFRQLLIQHDIGHNPVMFNAFDILYYRGINVMHLPLERRKKLLVKEVEALNNKNIVVHDYFTGKISVLISKAKKEEVKSNSKKYPHLYPQVVSKEGYEFELSPLEYFDYIILHGGEGIMLKPLDAKYYMKRGREYTKVKKFDTWDVVIMGFTEPTIFYDGKEKSNADAIWNYWCDAEEENDIVIKEMTMGEAQEEGLLPCTKAHANGWIGNVRYGVVMTEDELQEWYLRNPEEKDAFVIRTEGKAILEMGECSGIDDDTKQWLTENQQDLILGVIEVGANEQMKKTGRLRHPRYLRVREDKNWKQCIYKDHIH